MAQKKIGDVLPSSCCCCCFFVFFYLLCSQRCLLGHHKSWYEQVCLKNYTEHQCSGSTLFSLTGRIITKSRDFSWILSEKIFLCHWHVYDDWRFHGNRLLRTVFWLFSVFFSLFGFSLLSFTFCACFDLFWIFLEQIHIFFYSPTAGSGFKLVASKFKMTGLSRHCDVIIDTS